MRLVLLVVVLALLAGCGEEDEQPAASAHAELTVVVQPGDKRAEIRCAAEDDSEVCRALDAKWFEPTPGNVACTQQYGGPETATVTGTFRGEPIDAKFARRNGCEIARWEDAAPLLEAAR